MKFEWALFFALFVILGEDPGSIVEHCLLQRPTVHSGSRLKAGMTDREVRDDIEGSPE
jgi:hypothetical protein